MRRWLSNAFHLGLKEFASLASDKVLFAFIIYSFSLNIYSEATGIRTDVNNARVAVVDSDRSALSARIRDGLLEPYFRRPDLIDRSKVDRVMDDGVYAFVLDIPPDFEADVPGQACPKTSAKHRRDRDDASWRRRKLHRVRRAAGNAKLPPLARRGGAAARCCRHPRFL